MSEGDVTAGSTDERTDWTSALELMQAAGATEPIRQVRAAEQSDSDGTRRPRNKRSHGCVRATQHALNCLSG